MISNEEKILERLKEIYADGMQEITKLSLNSNDKKNFIISNYKLFNFDLVENCHPERSKEKSPDALFAINSKLYFIEFKEGDCKRLDLRMKIHEGIHALYQFSQANKILTREEFLSLNINYVVIKRHAQDNERGSEYLSTLENSLNLFSLKNHFKKSACDIQTRDNTRSPIKNDRRIHKRNKLRKKMRINYKITIAEETIK